MRHARHEAIVLTLLVPLALFLSSGISASATFSHGSDARTTFPGTVIIGLPTATATGFLPLYLGAGGIFAKYGLNINVEVVSPATSDAAMESGSVQFYVTGPPGNEIAYQDGVPIKLLGVFGEHQPNWIVVAPGITKFSQLAGKPVASIAPTNLAQILEEYSLVTNGVPLSAVTFVQVGANGLGAFESGEVDMSIFSIAQTKLAEAGRPGASTLGNYLRFPWALAGFWGAVPWMSSHKAEAIAVLRAVNATIVKWNADPAAADQVIIAENPGTSATTAALEYAVSEQVFNKGSTPLHVPTYKSEAFVNKVLRMLGFSTAYNSYAREGQEWTPTYWNAAFGKT